MGPRASSPSPRLAARPSLLADVRRHRPFYRDARGASTRPQPIGRTARRRSSTTGGFGARVPRPLPRARSSSAVWSTAPGRDAGLPGRLPAALPRQPRPDRRRPRAPVADGRGRLADVRRRGSSRTARPGTVRAGDPVAAVRRDADGRRPCATAAGAHERFDAVVMATHADDALALLADADPARAARPGRVRLHTATRSCCTPTSGVCRGDARAWASWNVDSVALPTRRASGDDDLPHEPAPGAARRRPTTSSRSTRATASATSGSSWRATFEPPALHVPDARRRRRAVGRLQGHRGTWYAGAHLGYGFHEDGCRSGFEAAGRSIGRRAERGWRPA